MTSTRQLDAYWIELANATAGLRQLGVTAYSYADALALLRQAGLEVDLTRAVVRSGIKVADLDPNHVVPDMGVIVRRGVWYPNSNASGMPPDV